MNSRDARKIEFAPHYRQLELDDCATWDIARSRYRRLVHVWHPDKFTGRPRERIHAQKQFISLTKSYTALRDFYRKNQRLPLQSVQSAISNKPSGQTGQTNRPSGQTNQDRQAECSTIDATILGRDPARSGLSAKKPRVVRKIAWLSAGLCTLFATVAVFLILDRNANRAVAELGREVLKEAPRSEFMPSASEIRRTQSRGAFVKPTR